MTSEKVPNWPPGTRILSAMPVYVGYLLPSYGDCRVSIAGDGEDKVFQQHFGKHLRTPRLTTSVDELRTAFLGIENDDEIPAFLEVCGPFRVGHPPISLNEFIRWQEYFGDWMTQGYDYIDQQLKIEFDEKENARISGLLSWYIRQPPLSRQILATVECDSLVEAIAATIALDEFKGAQFKDCGWCRAIFEVTKENGRQYCTQDCAHRAGQKRRRAAAKIQKTLIASTAKRRTPKGGGK